MQNQAYVFAIFILTGIVFGILFDIFRILRKTFKTPNFITYTEDILFWITSGSILMYSIFKFNNGILRLYIFIGIILGISIYILAFSKLFVNVSVHILNLTKKIFKIIIIIPICFIFKMIKKPIKFIYKQIVKLCRKCMYYFKIKGGKLRLKQINHKNKKDFAWICRIIYRKCFLFKI